MPKNESKRCLERYQLLFKEREKLLATLEIILFVEDECLIYKDSQKRGTTTIYNRPSQAQAFPQSQPYKALREQGLFILTYSFICGRKWLQTVDSKGFELPKKSLILPHFFLAFPEIYCIIFALKK